MLHLLDILFQLITGAPLVADNLENPEKRKRTIIALKILLLITVICIGFIIYAVIMS